MGELRDELDNNLEEIDDNLGEILLRTEGRVKQMDAERENIRDAIHLGRSINLRKVGELEKEAENLESENNDLREKCKCYEKQYPRYI